MTPWRTGRSGGRCSKRYLATTADTTPPSGTALSQLEAASGQFSVMLLADIMGMLRCKRGFKAELQEIRTRVDLATDSLRTQPVQSAEVATRGRQQECDEGDARI